MPNMTVDVSANTAKAKKEIDKLTASAATTTPTSNSSPQTDDATNAAAIRVMSEKECQQIANSTLAKEQAVIAARKAAMLAGAAALAHMAISTASSVISNQEGNATLGNRVSNIGGVTLQGAGMGAAIGMFAGPIGAAVGAAVGGLAGGITALITTISEEERAVRDQTRALNQISAQSDYDTDQARRAKATDWSLSMMGTTDQIATLKQKIDTITNGSGNQSIATLTANIQARINDKKTDLPIHQQELALLKKQTDLASSLQLKIDDIQLGAMPTLMQGADVSDSMSQIGGYVGNQVDIQSVNHSILDVLSAFYADYRNLAAKAPDQSQAAQNIFNQAAVSPQ